jgi:hypothetical protein
MKWFKNHDLEASNLLDRLLSSYNWKMPEVGLHGIRLNLE